MHDLLEMTDEGQHREHGFDQHPIIPGAAPAELEIGRIAGAGVEANIGQDDHALLEQLDQRVKPSIVGVGQHPHPADDLAPVVDQQTQFDPHDPTMAGQALATELGRVAPFSNRVDQFDAVTVHDAQQGRRREKQQSPLPVGLELPKQLGALGQVGKQRLVISRQPAMERPVADPLQGVQDPQGHHIR